MQFSCRKGTTIFHAKIRSVMESFRKRKTNQTSEKQYIHYIKGTYPPWKLSEKAA